MDGHGLEGDLVEDVGEDLYLAVLSAADDPALVVERLNKAKLGELLVPHVVNVLVGLLLSVGDDSPNFPDDVALLLLLRGVSLLVLVLEDFGSCGKEHVVDWLVVNHGEISKAS